MRVKLDRSFPALSRYEFETTPDTVLVGSSMTFRLFEDYFDRPTVRNLAISGGSSLTGLTIIASYQSLPRLILVETNILTRPVDGALVEAFGRNNVEPFKWFRPVRAAISLTYYWIKYRSQAEQIERLPKAEPADHDISAALSIALREYGDSTPDQAMNQNAETLGRLVTSLESRGCKILFFELPYPGKLGETPHAIAARLLMRSAFPDPRKWLDLTSDARQLRWIDAYHMDERSAVIVAQEIDKQIR
jgi:hypothetical protein